MITRSEKTSRPLELAQYWLPVAVWMLCISLLSGDPFSASNTNQYIDPVLNWLFPKLSLAQLNFAHSIIRKLAHFCEYAVLGWLAYGAFRRGRTPRWQRAWAWQALALAAAFSLADELHQAFVPTRTPSLFDSSIDSFGAAVAQLARYFQLNFVHRTRTSD